MTPTRLHQCQHFTPCPVDENNELFANGIFVFNITYLTLFLASDDSPVPLSEVRVKDFPRFGNNLDTSYVDSTDLSRPVIAAEIAPGSLTLIDGNHRMEKARKNGIASLPCYRLPAHIHTLFLTTRSGYDSFIAYWNEKIEQITQDIP
jgi:hypothetical protein